MKVVIFAGGTGSMALQAGLNTEFGEFLDYSVITNLFDNGLSTGACRTVMNGEILGPSDLRKNQMTRHCLMYGSTSLYKYLNLRITLDRDLIADFMISKLEDITISKKFKNEIIEAIYIFFREPKSHEIEYIDFSIANIIYSGLARKYDNSMAHAGYKMAEILGIPQDAVICSSDQSLYLTARTESGHVILDEGDIVTWNNDDAIVSIELLTKDGGYSPAFLSDDAKKAIKEADMIIYSSGTQWSSLIPTYEHIGFADAILSSKAQQYFVMNVTPDKDLIGVSGDQLIDLLSKYLDFSKVNIILSDNIDEELDVTREDLNIIRGDLIDKSTCFSGNILHDGRKLVKTVFSDFYKDVINSEICFDFDDTIVARNNEHKKISEDNLNLFKKEYTICTGNTSKSILLKAPKLSNIRIFSERGCNVTKDNLVLNYIDDFHFTEQEVNDIIYKLQNNGFSMSKIQNRNNTIIALKPIDPDYKKIVLKYLEVLFPDLMIILAGKTTIEISKKGLNKSIVMDKWFKGQNITFVGDEIEGNDYEISKHERVNFVHVKSVMDTNVFLKVLAWQN